MRSIDMINPNGDEFVKDDPRSNPRHLAKSQCEYKRASLGGPTRNSRHGARDARILLRENPVPTILGALVVGLAIGLAIVRFQFAGAEVEVKSPLGNLPGRTVTPVSAVLPNGEAQI